jgi:hypothetical protein
MPDDTTTTDGDKAHPLTARGRLLAKGAIALAKALALEDPCLLAEACKLIREVAKGGTVTSPDLHPYVELIDELRGQFKRYGDEDPDPLRTSIRFRERTSQTPYHALLVSTRLDGPEASLLARLHITVLFGDLCADKALLALTKVLKLPRGHPGRQILSATTPQDVTTTSAPRLVRAQISGVLASRLPALHAKAVPPKASPRTPPSSDFYRLKRRAEYYQTRAERAGIGARSLCAPHARVVFSELSITLKNDTTATLAAMVYLSITLGVSPSHFSKIALMQQPGCSWWLDLTAGHFVFSVAELLDVVRPTTGDVEAPPVLQEDAHHYFHVPIDEEILRLLRSLPTVSFARTLAELLSVDRVGWKPLVRDLLAKRSRNRWPVTLSALMKVGPRLVLEELGDEQLTDALFAHAGLGQLAEYHYRLFDPGKVAAASARAWRTLGLSGMVSPPPRPCWLVPHPTMEAFRTAIETSLSEADRLIRSLSPGLSAHKATQFIGPVALRIAAALVLLTGHRSTRLQDLQRACFYLEDDDRQAFVFVAEKYADKIRVVPLVSALRRAVEAYCALLKAVVSRLRDVSPALAADIERRLSRASNEALFLQVHAGQVVDLVHGDVADYLTQFGVRPNDGRRLMPRLAELEGPAAALTSVWMGRADSGQESHGLASAALLDAQMTDIVSRAEAAVSRLRLTEVHVLRGRWADEEPEPVAALCAAIEIESLDGPYAFSHHWASAVRRDDPVRYAVFKHVCQAVARKPPADPLVLLALVLILRAGVCNRHDVVAFTLAGARGHAYHDASGQVYIQALPEGSRLGLREVIGDVAMAAAVARARSNPGANDLEGRINRCLANVLGCRPDMALALLCDCASAVMQRFVPRAVAEHARGALASRVPTWRSRALALCPDAAFAPKVLPAQPRLRAMTMALKDDLQVELAGLINACAAYELSRGSQQSRRQVFAATVTSLAEDLSGYSVPAQALLLTAERMALLGDAGSTVARQVITELMAYMDDVSVLASHALASFEAMRDEAALLSAVARKKFDERTRSGMNATNLRAALGHLRVACDIALDLGDAPPPAGSAIAVSCVWDAAVERRILDALAAVGASDALDLRARAALALVFGGAALRAGELFAVRAEDIAFFDSNDVVVSLANPDNNYKTAAGRREIHVHMRVEHVDVLRQLVETMRVAGKTGERIFGGVEPAASNVTVMEVMQLIDDAVRRGTQDGRATTMALRRSAVTRMVHTALLPPNDHHVNHLHRRQALFRVAIGAGHVGVWTALTDYFAAMADLRHLYMQRRPERWRLNVASAPLLSALAGVVLRTAAKRVERHRLRGACLVLKVDWAQCGHPLASVANAGAAASRAGRGPVGREDRHRCRRFIADVVSGLDVVVAKRLTTVQDVTAVVVERMLRTLPRGNVVLSDADRALLPLVAEAIAPLPSIDAAASVLLPAGNARGVSFVLTSTKSLALTELVLEALAAAGLDIVLRLSPHAQEALRAQAASCAGAKVEFRAETERRGHADVIWVRCSWARVRGAEALARLRSLICAALIEKTLYEKGEI